MSREQLRLCVAVHFDLTNANVFFLNKLKWKHQRERNEGAMAVTVCGAVINCRAVT